jgi:hypothetical protein
MWIFRRHLIKRGAYTRVKKLYIARVEEGHLPTKSEIDELLHEQGLIGTVHANFSIEVDADVAEAAAREESMESYYDDMKAGAPVQCIGRRTRKNHKCCICMRRKKTKIKLKCGHVFHRKCIDEWARWKPVCPVCKDALELKPQPVLPPPPMHPPPPPPTAQPDTEGSSASALSI